ncbi:MAG: DUF6503 family protein [Myxococcota bacterium]
MTKPSIALLSLFTLLASTPGRAEDAKATALINEVQAKVGTMADLHALKDVEYSYTYRRGSDLKIDLSIERYVFDGELSYGRYVVHEVFVAPGQEGEVVQAYDGSQVQATIDGAPIEDPKQIGLAQFMRPTNFYWFAMMQKLNDPGVVHEYLGTRTVDGIDYEVVDMTFESSGEKKTDRYVLYINPKTSLVDQFLFTIVDFGVTEPFLMKVEHERFGKVMLPVQRRYAEANWEGTIKDDVAWNEEIMTAINFNNGFTRADFTL